VTRRWPLHPQPWKYQALFGYVRDLAETYGVTLDLFCRQALGVTRYDLDAPPAEALARLSAGTGIPVAQLEELRPARVWTRLAEEARQFLETPEGRDTYERMLGGLVSRNL
jgi:hypothetical protein